MEAALRRENVLAAYKRVVGNGGAPGVDGMRVEDLWEYCGGHWPRIRSDLLNGRYVPQAVRKVEIPKPDGQGVRMLGIPCGLDRMIQQALLQVLEPIFDPTFSEWSFGYRPGRSAHQAVEQMRQYVGSGRRWVVDIDLERFFDRVNHDVLMARVARRVKDKQVLRLIRRFLQAGMMEGGVSSPRLEGTPQGGPLSPLLSNVLLDELDRELEKRGHRFVRYADDCNVYVQSEKAGERVLASLERFLAKRLRLRINHEKSAVGRPWQRSFLGYSVTSEYKPRLRIAPKSIKRLKGKVRKILRRGLGRALSSTYRALDRLIRGWVGYYRLAQTPSVLKALDVWLRRRMRCLMWRQWKGVGNRVRKIRARGVNPFREGLAAWRNRGPWAQAESIAMRVALPAPYLAQQGLASLFQEYRRLLEST